MNFALEKHVDGILLRLKATIIFKSTEKIRSPGVGGKWRKMTKRFFQFIPGKKLRRVPTGRGETPHSPHRIINRKEGPGHKIL